MYGTQIKIAVLRRPILSAKIPDGTAPIIAPIAKFEAIHVLCSFVIEIVEFPDSNWTKADDVHDKPVPAAAAHKQTAIALAIENQTN